MRTKNFMMLTLISMLIFACSINAKPKKAAPVVVEKSFFQLAVEKTIEAESAFDDNNYSVTVENYNKAIELYNQALPTATETDSIPNRIFKLRMNIVSVHNTYAFSLIEGEEYDFAITEFESALTILKMLKDTAAPEDSIRFKIQSLYSNLAVINTKAGEYQKAIEYYDLYLESNPEDSEVLLQKFKIYKEYLKDENQAFEILKTYASNKNDFGACNRLGYLYNEKNDYDNAIIWYEKALSIKKDADVLMSLSTIYRKKQQWDNSTKVMEQYLLLNPELENLKTTYKLIADNYRNLKNRAKSIEYFEKYLELEYNEDFALLCSQYYYDVKNSNKSLNYANLILSKNPANTNAILFRAIARYNLKDMKGAKADFERLQNDPKHGKTAQQYLKIIK